MVKTFKLALALLCLPLLHSAQGQTASLVMDIQADPDAARASSSPDDLLSWKGKVFFVANEPGSGFEPWVSDGTATGTRLLADFCLGICSSNPQILGAARSAVLGVAYEGNAYQDNPYLWRSDGTPAGTFPLTTGGDRIVLPDYGDPGYIAEFLNDVLYFTGCSLTQGCELWRSDGTPAGTRSVGDLVPGEAGSNPFDLTVAGNRLFFTSNQDLWVSDGTEAGTRFVVRLLSYPRRMAALGNKIFFLAREDFDSGEELWVSDGTAAGTREVTAFVPAEPFRQTYFLKALGGKVYFVADDVVHGAEVWASDGTPAGTKRVTDFGYFDPFLGAEGYIDEEGLQAYELELLGDRLVLWATDGLTGFQPWASTGSPESTTPLCPGCSFRIGERALVKVGGKVLFTGNNAAHGSEVWASDGTAQGTALLKEACPGACDGAQSEPVLLLGAAFFNARPPGNGPVELWRSDGTPGGTRRFAVPGAYVSQEYDPYNDFEIAALGKTLFYTARTDAYGTEPWVSNGTPAGTRMVADIAGGTGSSVINDLTTDGEKLYFTACTESGARVWWSGGTPETTAHAPEPTYSCSLPPFRPTPAGGSLFAVRPQWSNEQLVRLQPDGTMILLADLPDDKNLGEMVPSGDRLLFVVAPEFGSDEPFEIWTSDGTPQGTVKAFDLPSQVRSPSDLTPVGSEIWFLAYDENERGMEIWRTDGTLAGTRKAADFGSSYTAQDPEFTRIGGTVFFFGADADDNTNLWKTDGTPESASLVRDLDPEDWEYGVKARPAELTAFAGAVYFFAALSEQSQGLFRSDGTAAGTVLIHEFVVGLDDEGLQALSPVPTGLTVAGGFLVFAADDGVHGTELWKSDGTAAGTVLLRDLYPGETGSDPSHFRLAAGKLYFSAHDGRHGFEIWRTDGTAAGTRLVQDLAPLGASSNPSQLTVVGDRLFFVADDGAFGRELWVLPLTGPACQPSAATLCLSGGRFKVEVSWKDFSGRTGKGKAASLTADTGTFWFFDPKNIEVIVKVLDGQGVNGHHWVFYGALSNVEYTLTVTDTATGLSRRYFNPAGQLASVGDTQGFGPLGAYSSTSVASPSPLPLMAAESSAAKAASCVASATRLCVNGGRFAVEASWKDFSGRTGKGQAVALTPDTGYFWFFDAANVEVVAKVLDGTAVNGKHWFFYGALSNVEYTLTVTDTGTGQVKTYRNPSNRFASVGDTTAF